MAKRRYRPDRNTIITEGFTKVPHVLVERYGLAAGMLFGLIDGYSGMDHKRCEATQKSLARLCNISDRQVRRVLTQLVDDGWIAMGYMDIAGRRRWYSCTHRLTYELRERVVVEEPEIDENEPVKRTGSPLSIGLNRTGSPVEPDTVSTEYIESTDSTQTSNIQKHEPTATEPPSALPGPNPQDIPNEKTPSRAEKLIQYAQGGYRLSREVSKPRSLSALLKDGDSKTP